MISIWAGPRPYEVLAISWDDLELESGEVTFKRAVIRGVYKATKNKSSLMGFRNKSFYFNALNGGEAGIRTLGRLQTFAGFQDQCFRPLSHLTLFFVLFLKLGFERSRQL